MSEASAKLHSVSDAILQIPFLRAKRRYRDIITITSAFPDGVLSAHPSLLIAHAGSLSYLRRHTDARRTLEKGSSAVRASRDDRLLSRWGLLLGIQYLHTGDSIAAVELLEESIVAAERTGDLDTIADASNSLGIIHSFRGDVANGTSLFRRALYAWQRVGNAHRIGMAHHNIAMLLRDWDDAKIALPHFDKAEAFYGTNVILEEKVNLRSEKALCYADLGDMELALLHSGHAVRELSGSSSGPVVAAVYRVAAILNARIGDDIKAYTDLKIGLSALGSEEAGVLKAELLEELAVLLRKTASPRSESFYQMAHDAYGRVSSIRHQARLELRYNSPG